MTPPKEILQRGKRIPNWTVKDHEGQKHVLWDYRQKSHLVLLYDPEAGKEVLERWSLALNADRKQWDWLNVKPLIISSAPKDMAPGVYAIDRYGMFLNSFPPSRWNFDEIEKEFLYYEASHC